MKENQIDWGQVRINMAMEFEIALLTSTTLCKKIDQFLGRSDPNMSLEQGIARLAVSHADALIKELKR